MQLGFNTAILPDLSLEEIVKLAANIGYKCIEVMCWPVGKAERRYAGVTHIDVVKLSSTDVDKIAVFNLLSWDSACYSCNFAIESCAASIDFWMKKS